MENQDLKELRLQWTALKSNSFKSFMMLPKEALIASIRDLSSELLERTGKKEIMKEKLFERELPVFVSYDYQTVYAKASGYKEDYRVDLYIKIPEKAGKPLIELLTDNEPIGLAFVLMPRKQEKENNYEKNN